MTTPSFPPIHETHPDVQTARDTLARLEQRRARLIDEQARIGHAMTQAQQGDDRTAARDRLLSDPDSAFDPAELTRLSTRRDDIARELRLVDEAIGEARRRLRDSERTAGTALAAEHRDAYGDILRRLARSAVETALLAGEERQFRAALSAAGGAPVALDVVNADRLGNLRNGSDPVWRVLRAAVEAGHLSRKDYAALDQLIDEAGESARGMPARQPITGLLVRQLEQRKAAA